LAFDRIDFGNYIKVVRASVELDVLVGEPVLVVEFEYGFLLPVDACCASICHL
jgi:hypothetical protein